MTVSPLQFLKDHGAFVFGTGSMVTWSSGSWKLLLSREELAEEELKRRGLR